MLMIYATVCVLLTFCCINVIFLEHLIKASPDSGNILLFLQFSFIAIEGFICNRKFGQETRHVPLKNYGVMVFLFFISSAANNMALGFRVPMPLHMIFKSGSLVANMLLGSLLLKRSYTVKKYLSVVLVSLGILICTLVTSMGAKSSSDEDSRGSAVIGVMILMVSLIASARTGIYQESVTLKYGKHPRETLFYNHSLPLPFFILLGPSILRNFAIFNQSELLPVPFFTPFITTVSTVIFPFEIYLRVPILWQYVVVNVITQYFCIRSVFYLISECSSLTVTLLITLRKFISLIFSVIYFQNDFSLYHWMGTLFVFAGSLLYSDAIHLPNLRSKTREGEVLTNGVQKNGPGINKIKVQ